MKYLGSKKIITDRLELRRPTINEQKYLWTLLMNTKVNKYFLTVPKKYVEKLKDWNIQKNFYNDKVKNASSPNIFEWSIFLKNTDVCIGKINCHNGNSKDDNIRDVSWIIDPDYQHQGYATEAAWGMLEFMFNECNINEIKTSAAIVNPASWKLMEKLGFERQEEKINNQYTYIDGLTECYLYYLNKDMYYKNKKNRKHICLFCYF